MRYLILTLFTLLSYSISAQIFNTLEQEVCDCIWSMKEMETEMKNADSDEEQLKAIQRKYEGKLEDCERLGKDKSDEELKLLMEYAKKCGDERHTIYPSLGLPSFEIPKAKVDSSEVCYCISVFKSMQRDKEKANGNEEVIAEINEAYAKEMEFCEKLDRGLNDEERKKLMEYAKKCMGEENKKNIEIVEEVADPDGVMTEMEVCHCMSMILEQEEELKTVNTDEEKERIKSEFKTKVEPCVKRFEKMAEINQEKLFQFIENCTKNLETDE